MKEMLKLMCILAHPDDEAYCRIIFDERNYPSPTTFYPNSFMIYTYGKTLLTPG